MAGENESTSNAPDSETMYIQEPMKTRGVVGEKIWGPYKTHGGSDLSAKYSGGPRGLGNILDCIIYFYVHVDAIILLRSEITTFYVLPVWLPQFNRQFKKLPDVCSRDMLYLCSRTRSYVLCGNCPTHLQLFIYEEYQY